MLAFPQDSRRWGSVAYVDLGIDVELDWLFTLNAFPVACKLFDWIIAKSFLSFAIALEVAVFSFLVKANMA